MKEENEMATQKRTMKLVDQNPTIDETTIVEQTPATLDAGTDTPESEK